MARTPSRKRARRDALFVLYQREVREVEMSRLFDEVREREGYAPDVFTRDLVAAVLADVASLDATINRLSTSWPVERLAPLERSVLRMALAELRQEETPPEVVVDEAVRLTRTYSTDESARLVNGILGAALREQQGRGDQPAGHGEVVA